MAGIKEADLEEAWTKDKEVLETIKGTQEVKIGEVTVKFFLCFLVLISFDIVLQNYTIAYVYVQFNNSFSSSFFLK